MAATIEQVQKLGITYIVVSLDRCRWLSVLSAFLSIECGDRISDYSLSEDGQDGEVRYHRFPDRAD